MRRGRRARVCRALAGRTGVRAVAGLAGLVALATLLPAGAGAQPPPAPNVAAESSTDLVDGDQVTVTATDVPSGSVVEVYQCLSGVTDAFEECDLSGGWWGLADGDGNVTATLRVTTMLYPGFGDAPSPGTDCREGDACVLRVSVDGIRPADPLPLHFDPDGALAPPPTISVTPDEQLGDHESVRVEGSGFVWAPSVHVWQCVADPAGADDCDIDTPVWAPVSTSGDLEVDVPAFALIETRSRGTVDCREPGSCIMAATNVSVFRPERTATAPVSFDADAAVLQPTLTVTPDSNLADSDTVTVTGSDFSASVTYLSLSICPAGASSLWNDCRPLSSVDMDGTGRFSVDVAVLAAFGTATGNVDCRSTAEPCMLVAGAGESVNSPRAARAALHFDPDAPLPPGPSIDVSPSTDLPDHGEVSVSGTDFLPSGEASLRVCQVGDPSLCDWESSMWLAVDASGELTAELGVSSTFVNDGFGSGELADVDCLAAPGCEVVASDETSGRMTTAAISFAPPGPPRGRYLDPVFDDVDVTRDVVYRETVDASGNPVQLQLDIYEPAGDDADQRPAVVWMPGDYDWFAADDKDDVASYAEAFARHGYVAVTMDYRMHPGLNCCPTRDAVGMTEAILDGYDDAKVGIAWLQEHAADYRIDPEAIASGGASAGATNSLGLAYQPDEVDDEPADTGIAAAVALSGNSYGRPSAGAVPVLAFHGGSDDLAPAHLSEWACAAAAEVDARCDVVSYRNAWHEIAATHQRDIVRRSADFLAEVMLAPRGYVDPPEEPSGPDPDPPPDPERPGGEKLDDPEETTRAGPADKDEDEQDGEKPGGILPRTGSDILMALLRAGLALAGVGLGLLGWSYLRRRRAAAAVGSVTGLLLALVAVTGPVSSPDAAGADDDVDVSDALLVAAVQDEEGDGSAGGDPAEGNDPGDVDPDSDPDGADDGSGDDSDEAPGDDGDDDDGDDDEVDADPDPDPGDPGDAGDEDDEHEGHKDPANGDSGDDGYPPAQDGFPDDWTEDQVAYAEALIADTETGLQKFRNPAILPLLGFGWITDGREPGEYQHWVNIGWVNDNALNPEHPESLVFRTAEDEPRPVLEAAMYMLMTFGMENIPEEIAWLPGWHIHDNLCFEGLELTGIADEDGNCERGVVQLTPPMLHVWAVDTPCGRFAGVDEHGLQCHQHS